jgi:hypothetical protein
MKRSLLIILAHSLLVHFYRAKDGPTARKAYKIFKRHTDGMSVTDEVLFYKKYGLNRHDA